MKRQFITLFSALVFIPALVSGYPAAPSTWTWKFHENGAYFPLQIAATTDPDGRLRTLFLDNVQPYYYNDGISHQVCPPVMQSFRPFPDGTLIDEYRGLTVTDYINVANRITLASIDSAQERRRTSLYSVRGADMTMAIGGAYRRLLPSESFGAARSVSHKNHFIGVVNRPVVDNAEFVNSDSDTLDIAAASIGPNLPVVLNEARLEVRSITTGNPELILRYSQTDPAGLESVFLRVLDAGTPAGWATNRTFTGGKLAMTSDRRDFYAFVTSHKIVPSNSLFSTEARLFRVRTNGDTSGGIIGIESVTSHVVSEYLMASGSLPAYSYRLPQLAIPRTNVPEWVGWENPASGKVHFKKHIRGTTGTDEEKDRTIESGYSGVFGFADGGIATGHSPNIAVDALGVLHFVYRQSNSAIYGRENSTGTNFESVVILGVCSGAPAVSVGPGQYPYVVFQGRKPSSPNTAIKLVVAYPAELEAAYKGDHEDRDKDGRTGLLERAQGSSDTLPNFGTGLGAFNPIINIAQAGPGDRRFEMAFRLSSSATRQGSTDVWNLPDGTDTLEIRPAESSSPGGHYFVGGFTVTGEFTISGVRFVTVRSPSPIGPALPSRFFTFKVRRIPGPP